MSAIAAEKYFVELLSGNDNLSDFEAAAVRYIKGNRNDSNENPTINYFRQFCGLQFQKNNPTIPFLILSPQGETILNHYKHESIKFVKEQYAEEIE